MSTVSCGKVKKLVDVVVVGRDKHKLERLGKMVIISIKRAPSAGS